MGFTDVGYMQFSLVADHYQHIAIIGLVALLAAGIAQLHATLLGNGRKLLEVAVAAVIVVLMFLSIELSSLYTDPITLYRATLEKNPNCWLAYNNLGNYYANIGNYAKAAEQYHRSLEIKPDQAEVYGMLGVVEAESGQSEQAAHQFPKSGGLGSENCRRRIELGRRAEKNGPPYRSRRPLAPRNGNQA